jgi:hypothetical protein
MRDIRHYYISVWVTLNFGLVVGTSESEIQNYALVYILKIMRDADWLTKNKLANHRLELFL